MNRQKRIRVYGSPSFLKQPSISASGQYVFDPKSTDKESKYKPFDKVTISNDSSSDVLVKVNGSNSDNFLIESGTSRVKDQITKFRTLQIVEKSGSDINSGELTVEVQRKQYNSDEKARESVQRGPLERFIKKWTGFGY